MPRWMLAGLAAMLLSWLAVPAAVLACTGEQPTFEMALDQARAIAVVEVVADARLDQRDGTRLVETIRGDPSPYLDDVQRTGLCGDTIEGWHGRGARVLVAYGVPFYGLVIHPSWSQGPDGSLTGSASIPIPGGSLADLELLVRSRVATGAVGAAPAVEDGWWILLGGATVAIGSGLLVLAARRLGQ